MLFNNYYKELETVYNAQTDANPPHYVTQFIRVTALASEMIVRRLKELTWRYKCAAFEASTPD